MTTAETVDRITRFKRVGLPVVSVYLGIAQDARGGDRALHAKSSSLLHEIRPLAEDRSLEREARLSLRRDIERIDDELSQERFTPGTAAIFSCSGAGLFERIRLPRTVRDRIVVDTTPWVRPLLAVLDEYHRTCVVVLDAESAQIWELYVDELRDLRSVRDRALRKPDYGGWYGLEEHRVRNRAESLAKHHFRRVATAVDELFRTERFELLVIGGHQHELAAFQDFLPKSLRGRVAGTFHIDPNTATAADIRRNTDDIVDRHQQTVKRRSVADVLQTAAAGRLAVVGLRGCLWAGSVAAVQDLLVQDGTTAEGVVCVESHWLGLSGAVCPLCAGPTRRCSDIVDELAEAVIDAGGSVQHVRTDEDLSAHLVAASLRFPLPPEPDSQP